MRNTIRRAGLLLGATAAAAALAGPAEAAQLQRWSGTDASTGKSYYYLFYDAASGVNNDLKITASSDGAYIRFDDVENINAAYGCSHPAGDSTIADCPAGPGVTGVLVRLMDGTNKAVDTTSFQMSISGDANSVNDFDGGPGRDELTGGDNDDRLVGGAGDDILRGRGGNDTLYDGLGNDSVAGDDGNDTIHPGPGADTYSGGAGIDTLRWDDRVKPLTVTLDDAANDGESGEGDNAKSDIERLYGGWAGDTIIAQQSAPVVNRLYGNQGDDTVLGGPGNDIVSGNAGSDDVRGEAGNDSVAGGSGNDFLWGGTGTDTVTGDGENDQLSGGPGADTLNGGAGADTAYYGDVNERVIVDLDGATGDDGTQGEGDTVKADVENLTGGTASDTLTGNNGVNIIRGGAGNDTIDGLLGADELFGDSDRDSLLARDGVADKVNCGADADDVRADKVDTLTACENVDLPQDLQNPNNPQNPDSPQNPNNPQNPAFGKLTISPKKLRLDRKGYAKLSVTCPKGASKKCTGTVKVKRTAKGKTVTVGSRKFSVAAGKTVAVKVKVKKVVRKALAAKKVKVTVVASARDAASTTVTAKRSVTFLRFAR